METLIHPPLNCTINHGSATILWKMVTPIIFGWFADPTWTNSNRWFI